MRLLRCHRCRDRRRHPKRLTIASSGHGTGNASTTCSAPRSIPIARQSVWLRSATCATTSSRIVPGLQPIPHWDPGAIARTRSVFQTGAWILPDERPLSPETRGVPRERVSLRFTSVSGACARHEDLGQVMIQSARSLGRRAILSRGWADLSPVDSESDCLVVGEVNQQALFRRVAAVVHHGGAGTTTTAALSGAPASRYSTGVRPALLGAKNPRPWHRNRARARRAKHRLVDTCSRAHSPTRCGRSCAICRHSRAPRRRPCRRPVPGDGERFVTTRA